MQQTPNHSRNRSLCWATSLLCAAAATGRLYALDGSLDTSFQSPLFDFAVPVIAVEANGKVLCAYSTDGTRYSMVRLTSSGNADAPLNLGDGPESITPPIDIGTIHIPGATNPAQINVVRPLPNGQFLVGGTFSHFNKVARKLLARLNSDGTVDSGFNAADGFTGDNVSSIVPGTDGKLYVGGKFTKFGSSTRNVGLVRLNADGTLDSTFVDSTISYGANVTEFSLQPDGKPLVDAAYANSSFQATLQVYRLGVNGGLDAGFLQGTGTPVATGPLRHVVMANGQILVTGGTTNYNGVVVNNALFRLNSDGSVDTSYPGVTLKLVNSGGLIGRFLQGTNGTIYFSGAFDAVNGQTRNGLARLKADGTLDPNFIPEPYVSPSPNALALQTDGKILGCATVISGGKAKYQIVRMNASGGSATEPARLGGLTLLAGGSFQMQVSGGPSTVIIQSSSDLLSWQNVSTNSVTGGVVSFSDPLASQSGARFYRLLGLP